MDAFLVIDNKTSSWRFDVEALVGSLREHWPDATLKQVTNPQRPSAYTWSVRIPPGTGVCIDGFISRTRDHVGLKGPVEGCLAFALWVRRLVPQEVRLLLGDDLHDDTPEITNESTGEELIQYFRS
jgi:hypothetical protein